MFKQLKLLSHIWKLKLPPKIKLFGQLVIHKHRKKIKNYIGWQPNIYKLNFVIRNYAGQVIMACSKALGYTSILQAEAQALKYGLLGQDDYNFILYKLVEGDSQVLINIYP